MILTPSQGLAYWETTIAAKPRLGRLTKSSPAVKAGRLSLLGEASGWVQYIYLNQLLLAQL
jgi:hypothetical protein